MKKVMFILIAVLTLYSCKKDNDGSGYNLTFYPNDTSLFINYSIDGIDYKYYQQQSHYIGGEYGSNSETLRYRSFNYSFDSLNIDGGMNPKICLDVWGKESKIPPYTTPAYQFFNTDNVFVGPKFNISLSDTAYIDGVSLSIDNGNFATSYLMKYFNYNYDTIYNHIRKDSYFKVTSIEAICNNYYLIEGEFETVLMSSPYTGKEQKLINIKKGKVRFVTNSDNKAY